MDGDFWETILGFTCTIGADGFPVPGELIRQVRGQQNLTQADVASLLGVSRVMVTMMETKNHGLESITTRRQLSKTLGILPLALGIVDPEDIQEKTLYDTSLLENMLNMQREAYFSGGNTGGVTAIEQIISTVYDISKTLDHRDTDVLEILCHYDQLALDVAREEGNDLAADNHARSAFSIAKLLKSSSLKASTLLRYCAALAERGDIEASQNTADKALKYVDAVPVHIAGTIYIHASIPYAAQGDSKAIDLATRGYTLSKQKGLDDSCFLRLTTPFAHLLLAQSLLSVDGNTEEALDMLNDAEEQTDPRLARRLIGIKTHQALALVKLKEYPQAADLAQDAAASAMRIKSSVQRKRFAALHTQLSQAGIRVAALRPFLR